MAVGGRGVAVGVGEAVAVGVGVAVDVLVGVAVGGSAVAVGVPRLGRGVAVAVGVGVAAASEGVTVAVGDAVTQVGDAAASSVVRAVGSSLIPTQPGSRTIMPVRTSPARSGAQKHRDRPMAARL